MPSSHKTRAVTCGRPQQPCEYQQQAEPKRISDRHQYAEMVDPADDCHLLALPDELLLVLLAVLSDPTVLACAAPVARRLHALCCDDALWRCLYEQRYGQPVHDHFAEFGKDWRWLYRARATPANSLTPASPGCAIVKPEGHYFCGELRWGVPHGYGLRVRVTLFPNAGDVVDPRAAFDLPRDRLRARSEGHWVRGSRHGRVYHYMPCGDRFEGNFTNGEYHGDGVYFHNSGRVYRGTYNHGERQGPGVEEYPDGRRYEGQWNCKRNGEGTMTLPDGRSHRGRWRAGKPHGWGVHTWPNGQRVEAVWRDGAPRGQGMLATADGRYFIDEAKVVFCLGRVMIPTDADATRKGGDDWGAHLKRIHVTYCADGAHQRTLVIDYIDGSQLLACWDKADLCAHRVGVHSSSCAAADRALSKGDENAQPTTALGTCMACLCDAHERRTQPDEWYFPASA